MALNFHKEFWERFRIRECGQYFLFVIWILLIAKPGIGLWWQPENPDIIIFEDSVHFNHQFFQKLTKILDNWMTKINLKNSGSLLQSKWIQNFLLCPFHRNLGLSNWRGQAEGEVPGSVWAIKIIQLKRYLVAIMGLYPYFLKRKISTIMFLSI